MNRILVTVLGNTPKPARYAFDGAEPVDARLAPAALIKLLPQTLRPSEIVALCTPEARKTSWPLLEQDLAGCEIKVTCADVAAQEQNNFAAFSRKVADRIPRDPAPTDLMVDVTHGPRHLAMFTLLAVQYVSALRRIELAGVYYGRLETSTEPSQIVDLRPLLDLSEWLYALRVFDEAADARPLGELLKRDRSQPHEPQRMSDELREISQARIAGLPLELGLLSQRFSTKRGRIFKRTVRNLGISLEDELWQRLEAPLAEFAIFSLPAQTLKSNIPLTKQELARQTKLIDDLLDHGNIPMALGLMDEWTVSWAVWLKGHSQSWLDYKKTRRPAGAILNSLAELAREPNGRHGLTEEQCRLGKFWSELTELRNGFAHQGMRPEQLFGSKARSELKSVQEFWLRLKQVPEIELAPFATETLMVTPLGHSVGVINSAIKACERAGIAPSKCLVLCSDETVAKLDEAIGGAEFTGPVKPIRITDPYGGAEVLMQIERQTRTYLLNAREVLVNLTGGTTLMGLAMAAMADKAKRLGRDVRRFGLIDRRTPAEQQADPFKVSEAFWLDEESSDGD